MPQFDVFTFIAQFSYATLFFIVFYLSYTRYFLKEFYYSIRFRQKLLLLDSKLRVKLKSSLIFTEFFKSK